VIRPHRFAGTQVDALVKLLGHHHGLFGRKAQLADGFLLELAGDERRQGFRFVVRLTILSRTNRDDFRSARIALAAASSGIFDFLPMPAHQFGREGGGTRLSGPVMDQYSTGVNA
jgi:hypothetical protein